jgi:hypothetical protein
MMDESGRELGSSREATLDEWVEKLHETHRARRELATLRDHRRKLRKACELALFGVTKDAKANDGQVDRDGIRETMEIVLQETK